MQAANVVIAPQNLRHYDCKNTAAAARVNHSYISLLGYFLFRVFAPAERDMRHKFCNMKQCKELPVSGVAEIRIRGILQLENQRGE
jgi:hypothetical protein